MRPCLYCGIVGDAGLEIEEAEDEEDEDSVMMLADIEESVESARSGVSAGKVVVVEAMGLLL